MAEQKTEIKETPKTEEKTETIQEVVKAAKKGKVEEKIELERIYVVNLRSQVMKAQRYRRAKKAVRTLKEFLAKHMHVENRDIRNVKVDRYLNEEIWQRGIRKPLMKVKVKAIKKAGIVYVELAEVPAFVKFKMDRDKKQSSNVDEKQMKQIVKNEKAEKAEKKENTEDKKEVKEKGTATVESGFKEQKLEATQAKHTEKPKQPKQQQIKRMALQK
jgi:large subunit ribosomal protein L31e